MLARHDTVFLTNYQTEKLRAAKYDYTPARFWTKNKKRRNHCAVLFNQKRCFIKQLLRVYERNSIIL